MKVTKIVNPPLYANSLYLYSHSPKEAYSLSAVVSQRLFFSVATLS